MSPLELTLSQHNGTRLGWKHGPVRQTIGSVAPVAGQGEYARALPPSGPFGSRGGESHAGRGG